MSFVGEFEVSLSETFEHYSWFYEAAYYYYSCHYTTLVQNILIRGLLPITVHHAQAEIYLWSVFNTCEV